MVKNNKFFAQSYNDALNDYIYSCENLRGDRWDWIVLTASNDNQAKAYQLQIDKRLHEKRLPIGTNFCVVPDYKNERVGSGGATLNVIRYLAEKDGINELLNKKILIIHSGGDSKRIPQYSACGKIFAPVPRLLPNGNISTIFDELIIAASDIPNRCGKGMMIFPSDTEILFNSLQIDLMSCDAAGLSIKAPVTEGQDHGVFLQDDTTNGNVSKIVKQFVHKKSETVLRSLGAVDEFDQVDIDTGCIWLSSKIINALYSLISVGNKFNIRKFEQFVNPKVCLNFYADFVYPLAKKASLSEYFLEKPENGFSDELKQCRKKIWNKLNEYNLSLVKLIPAKYIHFGMTHEMYDLFVNDILDYTYLGWNRRILTNSNRGTVINSYISKDTILPEKCYIENSTIDHCQIGNGTILSNTDIENCTIPANVVMHTLKLNNGKYVCRIYGKNDNPKSAYTSPFMGSSISELIKYTKIEMNEIWDKDIPSIWNARIYPECDSATEAVSSALNLYKIIHNIADEHDIKKWRSSIRHSLEDSFNEADIIFMLERQSDISKKVVLENFIDDIEYGRNAVDIIYKLNIFSWNVKEFIDELIKRANECKFPVCMRLYLACADICRRYEIETDGYNYSLFEDRAYESICRTIINSTNDRFKTEFEKLHFVQDSKSVELPVRVNFCGSPSDAAPYCLEHGGTMIDGALLLNGKKPIKVIVKKISEKIIRFGSVDQGYKDGFSKLDEIRNCADPTDPYALHKAVLIATGVIPFNQTDRSLEEICSMLGGGLELLTSADVPKGSGLGTSSLIAAAAVKAVNEILGVKTDDEMIYAQVFLVEQLMTTGGGWQDQVGGLTSGIKYFTSKPGEYQKIEVDHLNISDEVMTKLNDRFALIFSGQRRLARNVLREEMNKCIRNDSNALEAIKNIEMYCAIMRYYLLKGDITSFAKYITKQFELVKILDKGASNTCIEYIFDVCDDLIDGKSVCGAGGGGFLQVILKEGVSKEMLKNRIQEVFADCGVEVWDCQLV